MPFGNINPLSRAARRRCGAPPVKDPSSVRAFGVIPAASIWVKSRICSLTPTFVGCRQMREHSANAGLRFWSVYFLTMHAHNDPPSSASHASRQTVARAMHRGKNDRPESAEIGKAPPLTTATPNMLNSNGVPGIGIATAHCGISAPRCRRRYGMGSLREGARIKLKD